MVFTPLSEKPARHREAQARRVGKSVLQKRVVKE